LVAWDHKSWFTRLLDPINPVWNIRITRWTLVLLVALGAVIFFRLYRLDEVPPEMVSDHAEKLLDILDVLNGQTSIFFPRNTGREAIQMYLSAAVIQIFGTGYSFLSMKIGTAIAGLVTLPFIYMLGKEIGNRRAGLLAMVFAGIAYWPNVITRVALRFTFYPLFVAPALYFLIRGLRRSNRNDFILAGLALGIGSAVMLFRCAIRDYRRRRTIRSTPITGLRKDNLPDFVAHFSRFLSLLRFRIKI
jgi:hypothetical protein